MSKKKDKDDRVIKKVIRNKANNQLLVTIPKDSQIEEGDHVEVTKVPEIKDRG